jgi:hypothetical protein
MRPRLPHPLAETRQRSRRQRRREAEPVAAQVRARGISDEAVERARMAGGPIDRAAYSCQCGYQFSAPVSTTVRCPHCGTGQAW